MEDKSLSLSPSSHKDFPELTWLTHMADFLDDRFRIPGTNIRFGLDALLGLIPYLGDVLTFFISGFLVVVMARRGASGRLVIRMIGNIFLDGAIGTIPFLGDLFDFRYRANKKNVRLLKEHYADGRHQGSAWPVILLVLFLIMFLVALSVVVIWRMFLFFGNFLLENG